MSEKPFSLNLQELAKARNLTARQVAVDLKLPQKTVSEWFNGSRSPRDPKHYKVLADYFGVSVHRIMYGTEDDRSMVSEIIQKLDVFSGVFEINVKRVRLRTKE